MRVFVFDRNFIERNVLMSDSTSLPKVSSISLPTQQSFDETVFPYIMRCEIYGCDVGSIGGVGEAER